MEDKTIKLFGFEIKRQTPPELPSFAPKNDEDGAVVVSEGGAYGTYMDLDGTVRSETELINKYREIANYPEIDMAIDEIVNEAIVGEPEEKIVELVLDDLEIDQKIKDIFNQEFDNVSMLLEFNTKSYEIFRKWYIDGRLYYHTIVDKVNPQAGIQELRYIDPRNIRKVKQIRKSKTPNNVIVQQTTAEYYVYNEKGFMKNKVNYDPTGTSTQGIQIAKDSIVYVTSGVSTPNGDSVQSHLHKAIKGLNQLRAIEDSLVIYRISRAPERRIFYIDVGNLPKLKAEQYLKDIMTKFKNRIVYDASTGEIRDDRKFMTMLEDFWLPRREGGKGTQVETLPGGQNLGQIDDIVYFQQKLYKSLNVPISRLDSQSTYTLGRATEITRDEIKFAKFITRLRTKFSELLLKLLEKQLILKGVVAAEEWESIRHRIRFKFPIDNFFAELKSSELLRDRIQTAQDIDPFVGKYFSEMWVRRNVFRQSDQDIEDINTQMEIESSAKLQDIDKPGDLDHPPPEEEENGKPKRPANARK